MKPEKQNLRKNIFQYAIFSSLINNILLFYTKVFVKLFGDEMRASNHKSKINVRNTCELSEHMKRDIGLD